MNTRIFCVFACAALLAGCAQPTTVQVEVSADELQAETERQQKLVIEHFVDQKRKLDIMAMELMVAAKDICEDDIEPRMGFSVIGQHNVPEEMAEALAQHLDLEERQMRVGHVRPGSPADLAGVRPNDLLLDLNGETIESKLETTWFSKSYQPAFPKTHTDGSLNVLRVRRGSGDGEELTFNIGTAESCSYGWSLNFDSTINAYATGESVIFTTGIMQAMNDEELYTVMAHEIAHNAMKHIDAKKQNTALGAVLDTAIILSTGVDPNTRLYTGNAFSPEFESEADYVALYILARAGRDIDNAPDIWRTMSKHFSASVFDDKSGGLLKTHPTNPQRYASMSQAIKEIHGKQAAGKPLLPNIKEE